VTHPSSTPSPTRRVRSDSLIEPPGKTDVEPVPFRPTYVTRRRLGRNERLMAGGIAAGIAAAAFYLATIWLERTPLLPEDAEDVAPRPRGRTRR
jgi:hypothetical protein